MSLECFSSLTLLLSASLSLFSIISLTSVSHPPNFYIDSTSSRSPPKSFHIFSTTLSHLIPARPFVTFSHTALSAMVGMWGSRGVINTMQNDCSLSDRRPLHPYKYQDGALRVYPDQADTELASYFEGRAPNGFFRPCPSYG